ncbi:MAG: LysR substrate-binding domain-containing protein [Gammaproteobacteria bacterium]
MPDVITSPQFIFWLEIYYRRKEKTLHPTGNLKANTADPLRIAAIQGCGVVQLPTYVVGLDIKSGKLIPVLQEYEPEKLPVYAVYIHRRQLSVRTFVDFMVDYFSPTLYRERWVGEEKIQILRKKN